MAAQLKPTARLEVHDTAKLFPLMSEEEFADLKADIEKHGLREPIWLFEGKILDGRNRYRACIETHTEPRFRYWTEGDSLIDFVLSQNLHRRHLTSSQKAMLAVEIEKEYAKQARARQQLAAVNTNASLDRKHDKTVVAILPQASKGKARDKAAKATGANPHYVSDAKKIATKAPEVAERVKAGQMDIQDAKALASLDDGQRKAALSVLDNGHASSGREAAAIVLTQNPHNPQDLEHAANIPAGKLPKRETGEGEKWSKNLTELSRKVMSVYVNGGLKKMAARWSQGLLLTNYESICQMLEQLTTWKQEMEAVMKAKGIKR